MKILIVYRSYLGTTKRYAQWLQEDLKADLKRFDQVKDDGLEKYDKVVVCSGTYAGKMPLVGFLKKHWDKLKNKKVVAVAVGIAPRDLEYSQKSYETIPVSIRKKIVYYKLPGNMFGARPAGEIRKENLREVLKKLKR